MTQQRTYQTAWQCLACTVGFVFMVMSGTADGYDISNRWTSTKTNGSGLSRGDAITLTWSVVPDGESYSRAGSSELIDYLDDGWNVQQAQRTPDLTNREWWSFMDRVYDQYERVSGLTMVYEPEQDAAGNDTGKSGDIRIGGAVIDNDTGGILADNAFPNNGDMRIDTSRNNQGGASWWHSSAAKPQFRNLISHESGHGVGLSHSDISGANSVMETPLESNFWGLQFDDIYAFNRLYGDPLEKSGGNDSLATAHDLGLLSIDTTVSLGADAFDTVVFEMDDDWVGIDGTTDSDWFSFQPSSHGTITIDLTPRGPTYSTVEQGPSTDFSARSDLGLELYGPGRNGLELLLTLDDSGLGQAEVLDTFPVVGAADYYVKVTGDADLNQFYQLELLLSELTEIAGDVNQDGVLDTRDVDAFVAGWLAETQGLSAVEAVMLGDLDQSGVTDSVDAFLLHQALVGVGLSLDFGLLAAVPEPSTLLTSCGGVAFLMCRRRTRTHTSCRVTANQQPSPL